MRRSFFWRVSLRLMLVAGVGEAVLLVLPKRMWLGELTVVVVGCGVAAAWIAYTVRAELRQLEVAAATIPAAEDAAVALRFDDFEGLSYALAKSSAEVRRRLGDASESRRELEGLLDSMQDAVIAVDAAGRIQWTNQRMQRLLQPGVSASSAGGSVRLGHALVQTIRDPEVLACVGVALDTRVFCERRTTTLVPGRIFEVNSSPMPGGGAVAVLHDVTQMEEMERAQRDFVANVSHELRTPLTSITGYVETLLDHEKELSETAREFLSTILKNATRMNRLTEDLLVMARVESAEAELHPVAIAADLLVRDAVASMRGMVQDSEAVVEVGALTNRAVFADQDAVMQVLSNLIENAVKYGRTRENPNARVVVSAAETVGAKGEPMVEFRVRDYGQGVASEHLERIFERFYRVDKARSRESGGTGLGLAIAQHMVQAQGGTIRAESELNRGSTFIFTLPVA